MRDPLNEETEKGCNVLQAQVRLRSGSVTSLAVLDLSESGCLVDRRVLNVEPGDRILIKFEGLGYLPSHVRWAEHERAGLEFEEPLHPAVLTHLIGG